MVIDDDLYLKEDQEFERCINKCETTFIKQPSYIKLHTDMMRNISYQRWRGSPRASTTELLMAYIIRKNCGNAIADTIFERYYIKRNLLVARYTHQGLANLLGYKGRSAVHNHLTDCKNMGLFKTEEMPWYSHGRKRAIKIYIFGSWKRIDDETYIETYDLFTKFKQIEAKRRLDEKKL